MSETTGCAWPDRMPERCVKQLASMEEKLDALTESHAALRLLLSGNGEPEKGLIVRVDRLQQEGRIRARFLWALLAALLATVGAVLTKGLS